VIVVTDAQYVYRDLPYNVMPCEWAGLPFFYNSLGEGHYCGTSYVSTANNGYCYLHCDYSKWKGGSTSYEDESPAPSETDPGDVLDGTDNTGQSADRQEFEDAGTFFGW